LTDEEYDLRVAQIEALVARFPSAELTANNIKGYVWSLSDLPLVVLQAAMTRCVDTLKFFPTVAEIRENAEAVNMNMPEPMINCSRCHGTGMEQYRDGGYANMRRCDHVVNDAEDMSMFE
jgi:hypothetical protein